MAIFSCVLANMVVATRLTFALSRDKMLPGSGLLGRVNGSTHTPVASIDVTAHEDAPTPIYFTFTADHARWVALATLHQPHYTAPRKLEEDYQYEVIATPSAHDVAPWRGRELVVDGGCRETLQSFAMIARLSGDPTYADQPSSSTWR